MKTNHVYHLTDPRAVKRWRVIIARNGRTHNFGTFATRAEAARVAKKERAKLDRTEPSNAVPSNALRTEMEIKRSIWRRVILPRIKKNARGCWVFMGRKNNYGYGLCGWRSGGRKIGTTAHRIALEVKRGSTLGKLIACHHCDNPPCCNPAHLFAGTNSDNQLDSIRKNRRHKHPIIPR